MKLNLLFTTIYLFTTQLLSAQTVWQNPVTQPKQVVQGAALPAAIGNSYQRLANTEKALVRPEVWNLAQNTAGLFIEFTTNAPKIDVRYTTSGMRAMSHMPATGVSGVDLYVRSKNNWSWTPGQYNFKDTVTYSFNNIPPQAGTYRLYLPLYSNVTWLEVGVDTKYELKFASANPTEKPIVIYGTSIAQGGCASRPGLAWPAIFGRKINEPVINLGFSGNGRVEEPIINVMAKQPAKLFIIDCIPNLGAKKLYPEAELRKRYFAAVNTLQAQQPNTPILLIQHSGGNANQLLDLDKNEGFKASSAILLKLYKELIAQGKKNIYFLTTEEIGFTSESTVDGAHPNDLGMMENAVAVEKIYKKIFKLK